MEEARLTESQLTRLMESGGAPVVDRVVREGFPEEVILGRGFKEVTGQARWLSGERVFQVEENPTEKVPRARIFSMLEKHHGDQSGESFMNKGERRGA